jgi:hypothetical protein
VRGGRRGEERGGEKRGEERRGNCIAKSDLDDVLTADHGVWSDGLVPDGGGEARWTGLDRTVQSVPPSPVQSRPVYTGHPGRDPP